MRRQESLNREIPDFGNSRHDTSGSVSGWRPWAIYWPRKNNIANGDGFRRQGHMSKTVNRFVWILGSRTSDGRISAKTNLEDGRVVSSKGMNKTLRGPAAVRSLQAKSPTVSLAKWKERARRCLNRPSIKQ